MSGIAIRRKVRAGRGAERARGFFERRIALLQPGDRGSNDIRQPADGVGDDEQHERTAARADEKMERFSLLRKR